MSEEKLIYSGKAKSLYRSDNNDYLIMEFRDDMTAYNAKKQASFVHKGITNNHINAFIMETLKSAGIPVHFEKIMSENTCLVKHLSMIPVECVVRNLAAGSLCMETAN